MKNLNWIIAILNIIILSILLISPIDLFSQDTLSDSIVSDSIPVISAGPNYPEEVGSFLDPIFEEHMEKMHIPGAAIIIVKNGEVIFKKGYGYADIENKTQVDPDITLFSAGSVSKLLTATAIMQLYEQGKIDLNEDVNSYLTDVKIDDNFDEPVTVANLLTHTCGFEEKASNMAALDKSDLVPIKEYLNSGKQPRVLPPGKYLSYSNYGYTLLGYIIEQVSGVSFSKYIEENIFKPLGMDRSSFDTPDNLMKDYSSGYMYIKGEYEKLPIIYLNVKPAGSLISSVTDMANFMIAHLQYGNYKGNRILEEETARLMQRQLFTHHRKLEGWAHGFYERYSNDLRMVEHAGDIAAFASLLTLIPEENVGFYITYNGGEGFNFKFREIVLKELLDHYYPVKDRPDVEKSIKVKDSDIDEIVGTYRLNRYSRMSLEKMMALFMEVQIKKNDNNGITLIPPALFKLEPVQWYMTEPLLFNNETESDYLAFDKDEKGKVTHLNMHMMTPVNLEKIKWFEGSKFHMSLIVVLLIVFISAFVGWPVGRLLRKLIKKPLNLSKPEKRARLISGLMAFLNFAFFLSFMTILAIKGATLAAGVPMILKVLLVIPIITSLTTILLIVYNLKANKNGYWTKLGRIHYTLITLAMLTFIWYLNYWNLLGFHY